MTPSPTDPHPQGRRHPPAGSSAEGDLRSQGESHQPGEPHPPSGPRRLGEPRHHHDELGSTNDEARRLGAEGAPHGTTVTATAQTAGRGRQGRPWVAPPGRALTVSVVLRDLPSPALLPLAVAVAVARTVGDEARIKWPNDVVLVDEDPASDAVTDGPCHPAPPAAAPAPLRKIAGILCEGRPAEGWAVAGIGLNVALDLADVPAEIADRAATMGREPSELDAVLRELLEQLALVLDLPADELLAAWSTRDVLRGATIGWERPGGGPGGEGVADGVDEQGRLRVRTANGVELLDAGEVHLLRR
ncbi:biotin--[acetyl-CoA-carboxylase] ligase [Patulibacter sp.]|uniref:biotin--[acetyl-CoA-carboxylase] ligase n=1 Tax=Patulibacter sp. TaxID=1912859 RepID=UPI0027277091|nr:biotin--[acetyl-CoA-carboxylase] ligase [Patulibacter sp.]MDO9408013.1 biotin--[acetyl-CoA-carboxylase] ligase [Patulibacter sp.]